MKPQTQLLSLNAAEAVFAPFHDPEIASTLSFQFTSISATGCRHQSFWCYTNLIWENCPPKADAAVLRLDVDGDISNYDRLIFCLILPETVTARFEARLDGQWLKLGEPVSGKGTRMEIQRPIGRGQLTGVRATFSASESGYCCISLNWFGVANSDLVARLESAKPRWNPDWPGLIRSVEDWSEPKPAVGLLFDERDLPVLRAKTKLPGWSAHFASLETRARSCLARNPEDDLGDFLPWSDGRYSREREWGKSPYFWEALVLGFVGLINNDPAMVRHALRYLMCMVHTLHWCQSAESRLRGSTWDQRCFLEEMTTTSVCLLLDWLDFALTDRARSLIRQSLWDKGLAIIERDMMKFEYMYHMNQGPWFCRARILGGLMLEKAWPRVGQYADRAAKDMIESLDRYILDDGGTDEGLGYFGVTMQTTLPALIAYARHRGRDVRSLLPKNITACEQFVATMSAVDPGKVLMDGDNSTDALVGDTIPILAGLFPQSVYAKTLGACLLQERQPTYFRQFIQDGVFGFIHGPETIAPVECIVPTFSLLPKTGQLTSLRRKNGRSVRLHLSGAKANASHTHADKGGFTLELDGVPFLIDRGMVRYDDARAPLLKRTCLHNVITPCTDDGVFPGQASASEPVIPFGKGDNDRLQAEIDLTHVWREHMLRCKRTIRAESFEEFFVRDAGELQSDGRVAFHLQARQPFEIVGKQIRLRQGDMGIEIFADWPESIEQREELIDYRYKPVHHLILLSRPLRAFDLTTRFRVITASARGGAEDLAEFKASLHSRPSKFPSDAKAFAEWQRIHRTKLASLLMNGALPKRVPLDACIESREPFPGFTVTKVRYRTQPDRTNTLLLSVPTSKAKAPVLLALHGHESKWGEADAGAYRAGHIDDFCAWFAERGWAVLQPATMDHTLQHPGWTLQGEWTWDAMTALDWAATVPQLDMSRVAVCGLSTGGHLAMNVLALDDRVKAGVVGCVLSTWNHYRRRVRIPPHCDCGILSQLGSHLEQCDWAALAAPKPVQFQHGRQDAALGPGADPAQLKPAWNTAVLPQGEFDEAFSEVKRAYQLTGKPENVSLHYHPGGHRVDNPAAFDWLSNALQTG